MRDPKRIPKLLAAIQAYWEKNPDLRLGQLVRNLAGDEDVFYVEDSKLWTGLRKVQAVKAAQALTAPKTGALEEAKEEIKAHYAKAVAAGWCIQCTFPWYDGMCECPQEAEDPEFDRIARLAYSLEAAGQNLYLLDCELTGELPILSTESPLEAPVLRSSGELQAILRRSFHMIVIGLDVDSTIVTHEYPAMGADLGAIPWLKQALAEFPNARILLNTLRDGADLAAAHRWLEERGVPVWACNAHPTQHQWTSSPKAYCHVYVDDRSVGVPLRPDRCIDWAKFGPMLLEWLRGYVAAGG